MNDRSERGEGIFAHWPNRITAIRFVGSIVLFGLLATLGVEVDTDLVIGSLVFWLFLAVALSDILDGYLARRDNVVTSFGRIADPFVDKVLVLGTMIFLAVLPWSRGWFPAWIVVVVLSREFLVTGIRGYVESLGLPFPADWFGKLKMVLQCVAIGIALGLQAFPFPESIVSLLSVLCHVSVWGTLLTAVGSGITYVLKTKRILEEATL